MTPSYYTSITLDFETGIILDWEEVPYSGTWELAKKGREAQAQATQSALDLSKANQGKQNEQYGSANTDIGQMEAESTPGSLSPAAAAQLAADQRKIQDTYNNASAVGLKRIAQHGMGTLTGETSSLNNSLLRGQASDELAAHEQAQLNTEALRQNALNARLGLQSVYNPNAPLNTASESALRQSQMGSTLGDIGKGLTTVAGLAGDVVGMGGLKNLPGNIYGGK